MRETIRIGLVGLALLGTPLIATTLARAEDDGGARQIVTGTLMKLNLTDGKGMVKTDLGKPIFFTVTKPHLFERLSVGQRVTMELDGLGRADKVIDATITEFAPSPPEEPSRESVQPVG